MQLSSIDRVTRKNAINSIDFYQQYISKKKGFSCPHRVLHGGQSCSEYIKNLLLDRNLKSALTMSMQRFQECSSASKTLSNQKAESRCIIIPCCIPL